MALAHLQFHETLNDFLPPSRRGVVFAYEFDGMPAVKDTIEAVGVPHPEVAAILVNGVPVSFDYHVRDADRIDVYASCEFAGIAPEASVRPPLHDVPRFVADVHLGRLAAYLRMLGFDTLYPSDYRDEELARISSTEERVLLTRDKGLLKRSIVVYGYFVRETDPWRQLGEVLRRFHLVDLVAQLPRCTDCNSVLNVVEKEAILDRIPVESRHYYDEYRLCPGCGKLYWRGSHFERIDALLDELRQQL